MDTKHQPSPTAPAAAPLCAGPGGGGGRAGGGGGGIYAAVEQLMTDGASLAELTIEGIAQAAGVGKATIYRRWPNKDALLVDVLERLDDPEPQLTGASAREDMVQIVEYMRRRGLAKRSRWLLRIAFSQMQSLPALREVYYERVINRRRRVIGMVVERGIASGEFRGDIDPELLGEMFAAPMLLRSVLWDDSPLDDPMLPVTIVDRLLEGLGGPGPAGAVPAGGAAPARGVSHTVGAQPTA
ncbi:hypothetical protein GCM10009665_65150 [Kitasatospora nipponensis]|uniref:HTH tetR-type domain-containing protein n=1 Tax=Kitasatospora nipponensis TaxID=258049 RepID=A0ABN1WXI1_9ACTN